MRFIVDAQLPPALARWLTAQGHVAEHIHDLQMHTASDLAIWRYATTLNAVIITKDEDFATLAIVRADGPAVVWLRIGNTHRRRLLNWLERAWPSIAIAAQCGGTTCPGCCK